MPPIRISTRLTSDTLHLPELRPLIGQDVDIDVRPAPPKGPHRFEDLLGPPLQDASLWTGFDEALATWRSEPYRERAG